ncbi:DUF2802 domain-containing protein [Pseudomonas sp. ABC1]|uniref:DUF2802 domain-containing protein n=1 Tax=Pseudomonas sp. ABC1 TaxID=2748080 RepID=UPI0015C35738|nr:DUF2802 domain-containing protein [Pseudomonas sp. ABC1]QLF94544.1 DUF2802 domain-containing protein [Pseudomonas sp. ABC1]
MLIASLVGAVIALAVCCCGLLGLCLWLLRMQRIQVQRQGERDAVRDRRIRELGSLLDTYLDGNVRMGDELSELRRLIEPLPDKIGQLELRDPNNFSFSQAAKLVGMGATVEDLTQSCGLSHSEAELMSKLHQARGKRD